MKLMMDTQLPHTLVFPLAAISTIFVCVVSYIIFSEKYPTKSYPLFCYTFSLIKNRHRAPMLWTAEVLQITPTISLSIPFGRNLVLTTNPSNVKHILKTHFNVYKKDSILRSCFLELLGNGLFLVDGTKWKIQRQLYSHTLKADTFHKLVESVTMKEISDRLLPLFSSAAATSHVLDLQDIFHRLSFDLVCQEAFGYDPQYLLPSLPNTPLIDAYSTAVSICMRRYTCPPLLWKVKQAANIGSEKTLRLAINELREFIRKIIAEKMEKILKNDVVSSSLYGSGDLFDQLIARSQKNNLHLDQEHYIDEAISFLLAGDDTMYSALIWFFWLVSSNPHVEKEIVKEISEKGNTNWKEMVYVHASICESMRLYPPVPMESKQAMEDDIWPDGTKVKKGTFVFYNIFAMGRSIEIWGTNWAEFNPERWLERDASSTTGDWRFIPKDPFTYPVFQAGPRTCLGKDIAFMQIKLVAVNVLRHFQIIPAVEGYTPVYKSSFTSKMKHGFPFRVQLRC